MGDGRGFRFETFRLSLRPLELSKCGAPVQLRMQALRLLALLVERAGDLVTHDEIRDVVWRGRTVDLATSLPVCIGQIRAALGDDAERPTYIETLPKQGYRFLASVEREIAQAANGDDHGVAASNFGRRRRALLALAAVALSIATAFGGWLMFRDVQPTHAVEAAKARDAYLRGKYLLDQGDQDNAKKSVRYFLEALAIETDYAPAHIALAKAYRSTGAQGDAKLHALKAVALAPRSADAHVQVALSALWEWDWPAAGRHLDEARAIDPKSSEAHHLAAGRYAILGDYDAALVSIDVALREDPVSALLRADYGWFQYVTGNNEAAIARYREALELDANHLVSLLGLVRAAGAAGDFATAKRAALGVMRLWRAPEREQARLAALSDAAAVQAFDAWRLAFYQRYPDRSAITAEDLAEANAAVGQLEEALTQLERAADARGPSLPYLLADPIFRSLRDTPRFQAIRHRAGLPNAVRHPD